jgi:raffinose/stachyose/melibiose transport system permease protein
VTATVERALNYGLLLFFATIALLPIVGVVLTAFHDPDALVSGFTIPDPFTLESFRQAWTEGAFADSLKTSAIITVITVAFSTVASILTGYAFGTMRFRGATVLFYVFLFGLLMPFEATIIPLYFDFRSLGLTDSIWGVILPSTALSIAFGTFWMRAFFLSTPRSLLEAARIDGASSLGTLLRVLLPYGRPAILTMVVLVFMWTWNDFLLSLVMLSGQNILTAPLSLVFFQTQRTTDVQLLAAASIIVAFPVLVVYVFLQRHFIRGMVSGSLKG